MGQWVIRVSDVDPAATLINTAIVTTPMLKVK